MTVPPLSGPGAEMDTQSVARMISRSCSTMTTGLLLPAKAPIVECSPATLLGCSPTDGSSST